MIKKIARFIVAFLVSQVCFVCLIVILIITTPIGWLTHDNFSFKRYLKSWTDDWPFYAWLVFKDRL